MYGFGTGTATHLGGRALNEDAVLAGERLVAVADGVGGLAHGGVASRLALDTLDAAFAADRTVSGLLGAVREANEAVWKHAASDSGQAAMGTTLVALALTADADAVVLHVGDSRLYRLTGGRVIAVTRDHTVVAELVRGGALGAAAAAHHPRRHVLTRAIGTSPQVDADFASLPCVPGDRFLLCTDGLYGVLPAENLADALTAEADPRSAAEALVAGAVDRGPADNVTALVADVR